MAELTADVVLRRVKAGEKVEARRSAQHNDAEGPPRGGELPGSATSTAWRTSRRRRASRRRSSRTPACARRSSRAPTCRKRTSRTPISKAANLKGARSRGRWLEQGKPGGREPPGCGPLSRAPHARAAPSRRRSGRAARRRPARARGPRGDRPSRPPRSTRRDLTGRQPHGRQPRGGRHPARSFGTRGSARSPARAARLTGAMLLNATFAVAADLTNANLSGVGARRASFAGARLDGATLTGRACTASSERARRSRVCGPDWIDASADANGTMAHRRRRRRLPRGDRPGALVGQPALLRQGRRPAQREPRVQRGCHRGDREPLRAVQHRPRRGTELVIGKAGVLSGCQVKGSGRVTVHGKFVEREAPGIVGVSQLVVTSSGSIVVAVEQPADLTRFAFEPGCVLRLKIQQEKKNDPARAGGSDERSHRTAPAPRRRWSRKERSSGERCRRTPPHRGEGADQGEVTAPALAVRAAPSPAGSRCASSRPTARAPASPTPTWSSLSGTIKTARSSGPNPRSEVSPPRAANLGHLRRVSAEVGSEETGRAVRDSGAPGKKQSQQPSSEAGRSPGRTERHSPSTSFHGGAEFGVRRAFRPASGGLLDDLLVDFGAVGPGDSVGARALREPFRSPSAHAATPMAIRLFAIAAQCAERATPLFPL